MASLNETSFQEAGTPTTGVGSSIRLHLDDLPAAERRVGEAMLADLDHVSQRSVGDLAATAGASTATVVRLARRLGFVGFTDLKLALAREAGRASVFGHPANADGSTELDLVLSDEIEALQRARRALDPELFSAAVERIASADEVCLVGVGTSAHLAQLAAYRFSALGVSASAPADTLSQRLRIETLGPNAVVVAISHSGASHDTCRMAEQAVERQLDVIGITSAKRSPLSDIVSTSLVTDDGTVGHHLDNFASRTAHVAVLAALHHGAARHLAGSAEAGERAAAIAAAHQR